MRHNFEKQTCCLFNIHLASIKHYSCLKSDLMCHNVHVRFHDLNQIKTILSWYKLNSHGFITIISMVNCQIQYIQQLNVDCLLCMTLVYSVAANRQHEVQNLVLISSMLTSVVVISRKMLDKITSLALPSGWMKAEILHSLKEQSKRFTMLVEVRATRHFCRFIACSPSTLLFLVQW